MLGFKKRQYKKDHKNFSCNYQKLVRLFFQVFHKKTTL